MLRTLSQGMMSAGMCQMMQGMMGMMREMMQGPDSTPKK